MLWGIHVIVPSRYQKQLLDDLHDEHPGICQMKATARSYLWWPGLDQDIESLVNSCQVCQATRNQPSAVPLHTQTWKWREWVWQRIHIDFAEKDGNNFLMVIDAHSKWLEVFRMPTTTSANSKLRKLFASYGLPEEVVSDNGPQFTSTEFEEFMSKNGVRHT